MSIFKIFWTLYLLKLGGSRRVLLMHVICCWNPAILKISDSLTTCHKGSKGIGRKTGCRSSWLWKSQSLLFKKWLLFVVGGACEIGSVRAGLFRDWGRQRRRLGLYLVWFVLLLRMLWILALFLKLGVGWLFQERAWMSLLVHLLGISALNKMIPLIVKILLLIMWLH